MFRPQPENITPTLSFSFAHQLIRTFQNLTLICVSWFHYVFEPSQNSTFPLHLTEEGGHDSNSITPQVEDSLLNLLVYRMTYT